jgi:hypothetical protein
MLRADLTLLKSIKMYCAHPSWRFYERCWGCGKRRFSGQWWEGYQSTNGEANPAALAHWGWFCSSCIVIAAGGILDSLRFAADEVRIETLNYVIAGFDKRLLLHDPVYAMVHAQVVAYMQSIKADQQSNGY